MPAASRHQAIARVGNPAWFFCRVNRSSLTHATTRPSARRQAVATTPSLMPSTYVGRWALIAAILGPHERARRGAPPAARCRRSAARRSSSAEERTGSRHRRSPPSGPTTRWRSLGPSPWRRPALLGHPDATPCERILGRPGNAAPTPAHAPDTESDSRLAQYTAVPPTPFGPCRGDAESVDTPRPPPLI